MTPLTLNFSMKKKPNHPLSQVKRLMPLIDLELLITFWLVDNKIKYKKMSTIFS